MARVNPMASNLPASRLLVAGLIHTSQVAEFGYTRSLVELGQWVHRVAQAAPGE